MKTTKTHGLLLGLGVLGATGLLSSIQPAQADPRDIVIARPPYMPRTRYVTRDYSRLQRDGRTFQVITGRVVRNYPGNGFLLINDRGSTYSVTLAGGEPRSLSVGDRLQVSGYYRNGAFRANRWIMLRNR